MDLCTDRIGRTAGSRGSLHRFGKLFDLFPWGLYRRIYILDPVCILHRVDQYGNWDSCIVVDAGPFGKVHLCHTRHALYKGRCSVLAGMTFHWDNPYLSSIVRCLKTVTVTVAKNEREKEIDRLLVVFLVTMLFGWVQHAIYSHRIYPTMIVVDSEHFEDRIVRIGSISSDRRERSLGSFVFFFLFREGT